MPIIKPITAAELNALHTSMVQPGNFMWQEHQKERRKQSPVPTEVRREFRNAQRSIGRDITMTKREWAKALGTPEADFLARRLSTLQGLRQAMLSSYKDKEGYRHYNVAAGRMDAYEVYTEMYKGAPRLNEQRTKIVRAPIAMPKFKPDGTQLEPGQSIFEKNTAKKIGFDSKDIEDTPYSETAEYQDLMDDLEQAVREYDSDEARRIMTKVMHGAEAYRTFRRNR